MEDGETFDLKGIDEIPDPLRRRPPLAPAAVPAEPSPTRADRQRRSALGIVAAVAWVLGVIAHLGLRPDLGAPGVALPLAAWAMVGAACLALVVGPGERGMPRAARVVQAVVILVPAAFVLLALPASLGAPEVPFSWPKSGRCVTWASVIAAVPMLVATLVFRRALLGAPAWRGAAIGALCGLGGTIGIHLHCGTLETAHVLLAHGLPMALGAALGAGLGAMGGRV
ncbi:NrsF family protein [Polyangium aurulentum]|uniref:NrsF family protein n=1 Tax=Polyangium aurulentum TaxID=2567896 RepID=UPI0010AE14FF|nr:NrsF family protein [Polyangium aurulentum]UQA59752.1 DUF1109 domain-containing protein [Polyangium aurulentum]